MSASIVMNTFDITQHIRESNLIEGYDDPAFDLQGKYAWEFLSKQKELTHGVIKKVQKMLTLKQTDMQPHWRGYYRDLSNQRVWVGGRECLAPKLVPRAMEHWLRQLDDIDPKVSHVNFEKIHPFVDGNGRTGRMLMWWHEMKLGKEPTLILNSRKQLYYAWFSDF